MMGMTVGAWLLLGVIGASLERRILPHAEDGTFLGSLALAWAGTALGNLLSYGLGFRGFNLAFAVVGIVLILGGFRLARWARGRSARG